MNKPRNIGTSFESAVVKYLRANGFDGAERIALHGTDDEGDITLCPGVMAECKGGHAAETASDAQIEVWLADTERERIARGADVAILILKRKGKGEQSAGQWWVAMPGWTFYYCMAAMQPPPHFVPPWMSAGMHQHLPAVRLPLAGAVAMLRLAGWGTPLETAG